MPDLTGTGLASDAGPGNCNLAEPLFQHSLQNPGSPALVLEDQVYSYAELAALAARVAGWIVANTPAGARRIHVGIIASRSLGAYAGILGACWAGATYIPINPKLPVTALRRILTIGEPAALVVDAAGWASLQHASLPDNIPILRFPAASDGSNPPSILEKAPGISAPARFSGDQPAYIIFTSGTTGSPKGVIIRARSVRHFLDFGHDLYHLDVRDRVSNFSAVSFDFSVLDLWLAWDAGASLHVVPERHLLAPSGFIQDHQLTFWASVPSVIVFMMRLNLLKEGSFPSLRHSYFCGEALPLTSALAWQRAAPNSVIDNHYGPTEATVACSMVRLSDPPSLTPGRDILSIGKPYPGMQFGILGPGNRFLPQGEPGELAISGPQVAAGYLGAPEATQSRFVEIDHPESSPAIWYLTGDLAFEDAGGTFHHLGRMDNQVKVLGHRLELEEVDAHLREACECVSAATVAWPTQHGTASGLVAFIAGTALTPQEIMGRLKERLPEYALPREIVFLQELPLTANGKTDRAKLAATLERKDRPHAD